MNQCYCGSGKLFKQCCQPYLKGKKYPKTPEKLMRSRFTAFALGGYGTYLLKTWAVEQASHLSELELSQKTVQWQSLEVIAKSQQGDSAQVEFKARFLDTENHLLTHHEISRFERRKQKWVYVMALE